MNNGHVEEESKPTVKLSELILNTDDNVSGNNDALNLWLVTNVLTNNKIQLEYL